MLAETYLGHGTQQHPTLYEQY